MNRIVVIQVSDADSHRDKRNKSFLEFLLPGSLINLLFVFKNSFS